MTKEFIRTTRAPLPVGRYSQAIKAGSFLFVAGQGPFDPKTGKMAGDEIESQTHQTLQNIKAIVEASGFTLQNVVMISVFLKNSDDFKKMNEVYKGFFSENLPTRTTVAAGFVTSGMLIEVNAIAYRE
jgi:2-iminobutanoate/2-iminopropanoate deaminase